MKCPNCGYEIHREPKEPYEYNGYLKPYLPVILDMLRAGKTPNEIADTLRVRSPWDSYPDLMIAYIARRYNLKTDRPVSPRGRNQEIVTRYHAGTHMSELAREYGISRTRIRQIIERAGR